MKKAIYDNLDKALLDWFNIKRAQGNLMNQSFAAKLKDLFNSLRLEGPFEASSG